MEYIQIFFSWVQEVIWPLIAEKFTDLFELVKELFGDLIPAAE